MNPLRTVGAIVAVVTLLGLSSCATVGNASASAPIERTVELFDTGIVGEIVALCANPMLFDGEVIVRESDMRTIIAAIEATDVDFSPERITSIEDGKRTFATVFGRSFELDVFDRKYVPDDAVIVTVGDATTKVSLLLGDRNGEYRTILGLAVTK